MEKISRRGFGLALLSSLGMTNLGVAQGFFKKTEDVFIGRLGRYVKRKVTGYVTACKFNRPLNEMTTIEGITCWDEYPYKEFKDAVKYDKPVLCFPMENKLEIYYERGIETYICFNLKRKQKERILQMPIAKLDKILKSEASNEWRLRLQSVKFVPAISLKNGEQLSLQPQFRSY